MVIHPKWPTPTVVGGPSKGQVYRHYLGGRYEVVGLAAMGDGVIVVCLLLDDGTPHAVAFTLAEFTGLAEDVTFPKGRDIFGTPIEVLVSYVPRFTPAPVNTPQTRRRDG